MHLVRLIYFSENYLTPTAGGMLGALNAILSVSRRNNERNGITGALVFDDQWFYQALEGERGAVLKTFLTILDDSRHGGVVLAECIPTTERLFGRWAMRLAARDAVCSTIFERFTVDGVVRPQLMTSAAVLDILLASTGGRAAAPVSGQAA